MTIGPVKSAPQLTRLFRELPEPILGMLLAARPFSDRSEKSETAGGQHQLSRGAVARDLFAALHPRDLVLYEDEAARIARLDDPRADALHLRLAEGVDHDCRREMEAISGALARSAHSYCHRPALFRAIERAMQLRSYREHRRIYEAHDLAAPKDIDLDAMDTTELERAIVDRLDLSDGCDIEAVELPATDTSDREIMLAVVAGGALASQKTFERDKGIDMIHYRPANELILVYRPAHGTIEVCGRDWSDRTAVATLFARQALDEELSERPLKQRNYDLRPLARNLRPEIPDALADRILALHVTEARYALGSYERKMTVTATAGEPIGRIAADALQGLGSRHGRPFLCDVELFLRVSSRKGQPETLRFRVTNQNRSTLQSETDPDKRKIGFELLEALGIVTLFSEPDHAAVSDLLPGLLKLLDHEADTIGWNELRDLDLHSPRVSRLGFLHQRTIAATVLVDEEDLGPVEAIVIPDLVDQSAALGLSEDDVVRKVDLDPLLSWSINRAYVRETILKRLSPLALARKPTDCGHDLLALGNSLIGGELRPVYLWERSCNLKAIEKVDRLLRDRCDSSPGLVLVPDRSPVGFLGKHLVTPISSLLDHDQIFDPQLLAACWAEGRSTAEAADGPEFDSWGDRAVLRIPGEDPWTIVGRDRVELVRKLHAAWKRRDPGVLTGKLVSHTKSASPQAVLGPDWKPLIVNRYVYSPRRGSWALKVPPA